MDHQRVVAIAYDRRGRVLAIGRNSYVKTHPIQSKYAMEAHRPERCIFTPKSTLSSSVAFQRTA